MADMPHISGMKSLANILSLLVAPMLFTACSEHHRQPADTHIRRFDPATTAQWARTIDQLVKPEVADSLAVHVWGVDSLVQSPVAINVDDSGKLYFTTTGRQNNSEFDIRSHRDWEIRSIALQTVEDRRQFLHTELSPANSSRNTWLKDVNGDSSHDWRDLTVEKEYVYRLQDLSGDGVADQSQMVVGDFHDEVTDVAGGVLSYGKDLFVAVAPDLWRLNDTDGDGVADKRQSISNGYAVHIGFSGHGMSGIKVGPDGRIYWQIGDIGFNGRGPNGERYAYPNSGVIVRSNPDGSDFEVFASGLRNTHEFAFDQYGNLISEDNDGDHPGEKERLVYVVNGSDAGWRSNWQYGKYNDPDNNEYKVWMDEKMWLPRWNGQAAYIVPCISNFVSGPAGFTYNPGTALNPSYRNHFFVAEFVGNPAKSGVHAFVLNPKGAGFELGEHKKILGGVLPTGLDFGPDGSLYVADWIDGWRTKSFSRIWKINASAGADSVAQRNTQQLLVKNYAAASLEELASLLGHADMRVRLKAQFELAQRDERGFGVFRRVLAGNLQLARIHAVWGISQLARRKAQYADVLVRLLHDADPELRAQAAKWLGDIRYAKAGTALTSVLQDGYPRARFFAAEALGRIAFKPAIAPLIDLLRANNDEDAYIRHAATLALARIGDAAPLVALRNDPSRALRIAAVVALRRLANGGIAQFVNDADEFVVTEAARGINDDLSINDAIPALAAALNTTPYNNEPLLRRCINANLRVGKAANIQALLRFASDRRRPAAMRSEAVATLGTWITPSVLDRVDGRFRGAVHHDAGEVRLATARPLAMLLNDHESTVRAAVAEAIAKLDLREAIPSLRLALQRDPSPDVRVQALNSLARLKDSGIANAIQMALSDKDQLVRVAGIDLVSSLHASSSAVVSMLVQVINTKSVEEKQAALLALGKIPGTQAMEALTQLVDKFSSGKLPPEVEIELEEAIDSAHAQSLAVRYHKADSLRSAGDVMAAYKACLFGGSEKRGKGLFFWGESTQCTRCHSYDDMGGNAGPRLNGVASRISREQILQAIVDPSARLAPGFGTSTITLKDGQTLSGVLMTETTDQLTLKSGNEPPRDIAKSSIAKRTNAPSSMPEFKYILSKKDIRDLVSFLSTLKKE